MKVATLAIILKADKVLLGFKKKGEIGTGTLNGPGGKCEGEESPVDCVIRETKEEVGLTLYPERLKEVALITFYAAGVPDFEVHIFCTNTFGGIPQETVDMIPKWYDIDNLPLDQMLESDREWFSKAIQGETFCANVYYKKRAAEFERMEFLPFLPEN